MRINGIKICKVSPDVITYYRQNVKGNSEVSDEQISLKLSRNIELAHTVKNSLITGVYVYGNLRIIRKLNKIVEVFNHPMNYEPTWKLDKNRYIELNKLLGIKDCKFTSRKKKKSLKHN